jgi:D-lactate dehydrogenase (cytochrome)
VYAESTEDVAHVIKLCNERRVPVTAYATGSSLEGHVQCAHGGISLDMSRMNKVVRVNTDDMDCTVQAGVLRKQLDAELRDTGLFFPIDPGADASIGGMCATRASGTNAVKYGTVREQVLNLTAVLPDGSITKTGTRAKKSSAGYDLTHLLIGSEGTLGIITEINLRLHGRPENVSAAVCCFDDMKDAVEAVMVIMQAGLPVARIELLDDVQMKATNSYSGTDHPEKATLFFEFHGTESGIEEVSELTAEFVEMYGGSNFQWADTHEDREALWDARHNAYWAAKSLRPGCEGMPTDVCVPLSNLSECILETTEDVKANQLYAPLVGHVGDGNFHMMFILDKANQNEMERAKAVNHRLVQRAQRLGGTCTGEHGVGLGKLKYLEAEHGVKNLEIMALIKEAIDPKNIMNPGKLGSRFWEE